MQLHLAAEGNVKIVEDDELQRPALEWSLGDVGGALRYRKMDEAKDFGRFNRVRPRERAWDDEDRKGVGRAAKLSMNIFGRALPRREHMWKHGAAPGLRSERAPIAHDADARKKCVKVLAGHQPLLGLFPDGRGPHHGIPCGDCS